MPERVAGVVRAPVPVVAVAAWMAGEEAFIGAPVGRVPVAAVVAFLPLLDDVISAEGGLAPVAFGPPFFRLRRFLVARGVKRGLAKAQEIGLRRAREPGVALAPGCPAGRRAGAAAVARDAQAGVPRIVGRAGQVAGMVPGGACAERLPPEEKQVPWPEQAAPSQGCEAVTCGPLLQDAAMMQKAAGTMHGIDLFIA